MTILVTGAQGQLGSELCRRFGRDAIGVDRPELDITDRAAVERFLADVRPTAVINCAAFTQVDLAEQESEQCWQVNAYAVDHLAGTCDELDCLLVQISTDYVFGADVNRSVPYREEDPTGPLSVYGTSKLRGEQHAARCQRHIIVRSCGLFGLGPGGSPPRNFVETMLRLAAERDCLRVVADQHCTPTSVSQLARAIEFLIETAAAGTFHVTNAGDTTWYDFALEIFRQTGTEVRVDPITTADYGAPARRPSYSVLDIAKYAHLGGPPMSDWQSALAQYLSSRDSVV